jgi:hypothetical protein
MVLTAELIPPGLSGNSLQKALSTSVWARLRTHVIGRAGSRCEICGFADEHLHAHEAWEYIDASEAPWLDAGTVEAAIANRATAKRAKHEQLAAIMMRIFPDRADQLRSDSLRNLQSPRPTLPKVAILHCVQALCRLCHLCKHYKCIWEKPRQIRGGAGDIMRHWCRVNKKTQKNFIEYYRNELLKLNGALIVKVEYCGYDELAAFRNVAEWQEAQQDERTHISFREAL